jgi:hypothetical protein
MLVCHGLELGYSFKYDHSVLLHSLNTSNLMTNLLTPIKMVTSGKEQMGALFLGLGRVIYLINRCRIYEILYIYRPQPKDPGETLALENLTSALVELYAIILLFLAKSTGFLGNSIAQRALSAFLNPTDVIDLEKKCDSSEKRAETEAGNCERYCRQIAQSEQSQNLMNLLEQLEDQNNFLGGLNGKVDILSSLAKGDEQNKILSWISEIQFQKIHNLAKDGRTANTGQWLIEHKEFREWCTLDQSKILWLHGIRKFTYQSHFFIVY